MAIRPTATLVLFLAFAGAVAPASASTSVSGSAWQETVKPPRLTASEIHQLQAKAAAGDATAQSALGKAYKDGNGVAQNDESALKWFRKAADQGDAGAENSLGVIYRMGSGVARDKEEAVRWYLKSAKQGNSKAMFNLGAAYYNGDGVEVDDVASFAWFLLAQDAGDSAADEAVRRAVSEKGSLLSEADVKVAQMYEAGDELPKNPEEALKWYRKAGDAGDAKASVTVAKLLLSAGRSPTPEEGAEARRRCEDAAKQNFSPGDYCMVLIYKQGLGTLKDPVEAQKWLGRAAELGHPQAALELGEAYWRGEVVKTDLVTAYMWIWLALNAKVPGSQQDEQALQKELSPKQVEQAKRQAREWVARHRLPTIYERQGGNLRPQH